MPKIPKRVVKRETTAQRKRRIMALPPARRPAAAGQARLIIAAVKQVKAENLRKIKIKRKKIAFNKSRAARKGK